MSTMNSTFVTPSMTPVRKCTGRDRNLRIMSRITNMTNVANMTLIIASGPSTLTVNFSQHSPLGLTPCGCVARTVPVPNDGYDVALVL